MSIQEQIDEIRTRFWLSDLMLHRDESGPHALGKALDPKAVWQDAFGVSHHSKWYGYFKQRHVPGRALVQRIGSAVPELTFDIHHPIWSLLRKPTLSGSSLRRLRAQMPTQWHAALTSMRYSSVERLRMGREIVETALLDQCSYLDAVFLFDSLLRFAEQEQDNKRADALIAILYALPLIYCDDFMFQSFTTLDTDEQWGNGHQILAVFDTALGLDGVRGRQIRFPHEQRLLALWAQHCAVNLHRRQHRRALRDAASLRRFLAQKLELQLCGPTALSKSAFRPACSSNVFAKEAFTPPIDERLWRWAWETKSTGFWRLESNRREIEQVWKRYQQHEGEAG